MKCPRLKFDNIGIAFRFKHTIIAKNIAGKKPLIIQFIKNYGELEKPILDLENGNRRIDALDVSIVLNDFPK